MYKLRKGFALFMIVVLVIIIIVGICNNHQGEISCKEFSRMKIFELGIVEVAKSKPTVSEVLEKKPSWSFSKEQITKTQEFVRKAEKVSNDYELSWSTLLVAKDGKGRVDWVCFTIFYDSKTVVFGDRISKELYKYFEEIGVAKKPQINLPEDPNDLMPSADVFLND